MDGMGWTYGVVDWIIRRVSSVCFLVAFILEAYNAVLVCHLFGSWCVCEGVDCYRSGILDFPLFRGAFALG